MRDTGTEITGTNVSQYNVASIFEENYLIVCPVNMAAE